MLAYGSARDTKVHLAGCELAGKTVEARRGLIYNQSVSGKGPRAINLGLKLTF
jgi:hypothetical protein